MNRFYLYFFSDDGRLFLRGEDVAASDKARQLFSSKVPHTWHSSSQLTKNPFLLPLMV